MKTFLLALLVEVVAVSAVIALLHVVLPKRMTAKGLPQPVSLAVVVAVTVVDSLIFIK